MSFLSTLSGVSDGLSSGASAIGALGSIASLFSGTRKQKELYQWQIRQNLAAQRQLNRENYDRQLDFWNRNNEYNSPVSQKARLGAAGLLGSMAANNASIAASSSNGSPLPTQSAATPSGIMSSTAAAESFAAQSRAAMDLASIANVRADTRLKESQSLEVDSQRSLNEAMSTLTSLQGVTEKQRQELMSVSKSISEFDLNFKRRTFDDSAALISAQKQNLINLASEILSRIPLNEANTASAQYSIRVMASQIGVNEALAELHRKGVEVSDAQIAYLRQLAATSFSQEGLNIFEVEGLPGWRRHRYGPVLDASPKQLTADYVRAFRETRDSPSASRIAESRAHTRRLEQESDWNTYNKVVDGVNAVASAVSRGVMSYYMASKLKPVKARPVGYNR